MLGLAKKKRSGPKRSLRRVLGNYSLPTFPAIAMKAMKMLRDDSVSLHEVAGVLMTDPGLSSTMLSMVNSASSALSHPVTSISHAATLLGRSQIETMLVAVAASRALPTTLEHLDMCAFWRTSTRRAAIAGRLADELHAASQANSYTAGLLQDMAIPILMQAKKRAYGQLFDSWLQEGGSLIERERDAFGWDHAEVGAWLCQDWNFPAHLTAAIAGHHGPGSAGEEAEPAVRLASLIRGGDDDADYEALIEVASRDFGLDPAVCRPLLESAGQEGDAVAKLFR